MQNAPFRSDLSPDERFLTLIKLLREMEPEQPYHIPGDGKFLWNFAFILKSSDCPLAAQFPFLASEETVRNHCGTAGCAMGLAQVAGLALPKPTCFFNFFDDVFTSTYELRVALTTLDDYPGARNMWDVKPAQVADRLEQIYRKELAERARFAEIREALTIRF